MKRIQVGLALGNAAMILALWAAHPRAGMDQPPKRSKSPRSAPEATAPPLALAQRPLQVEPEAKAPEPSPPFHPNQEAMLTKRRARLENASALGVQGPREYLKGIPAGLGDMGREAAIRKTADHLSIEAGSRSAFVAAARQSVQDLELARALRSREVSALGVISPSVGNELWSSTERYAAAREGALGRVEPYLGQSPAAQEFRQEFDSWAALVVSKGQRPHQ